MHKGDMNHHVWPEASMCDMSHSRVRCRLLATTHNWVMSHIYISHVTHMNETCLMYEWIMSRKWISHISHTYKSCHTPRMNARLFDASWHVCTNIYIIYISIYIYIYKYMCIYREIMLFIDKSQTEDQIMISYATRSFERLSERICIKVCGVVSQMVSGLWFCCDLCNKLMGDRAFDDLCVCVRCQICSDQCV